MNFYKTCDFHFPVNENVEYKKFLANKLLLREEDLLQLTFYRKAIDARKKNGITWTCSFAFASEKPVKSPFVSSYEPPVDLIETQNGTNQTLDVIVVGSGPAGLFAALKLAKAGINPTLVEQGGSIEERIAAVNGFFTKGKLDKNSNIQFGAGGAGTFSDGKLTSGIRDSYSHTVFNSFVKFGAPDEIHYSNMPHVGTDKLVGIVKGMISQIQDLGGKVLFNTKLVDLSCPNGVLDEITLQKGKETYTLHVDRLVLAIGHSSRDTYEMLVKKLECRPKNFAAGLRIEHERKLIDQNQFGSFAQTLGAASYRLAAKTDNGRSVFSFCMCPGGEVVSAASEENACVSNGMSSYARDGKFSNSALVVNVNIDDYFDGNILSGVSFQRKMEASAYKASGCYSLPCCNTSDFLTGRTSPKFDHTPTVKNGVTEAGFDQILPAFIAQSIRQALPLFGRKIRGFDESGVLIGVESRTSAPLRILRNENLVSSIMGVYPCGEGAGYAGGIVSAGVDGLRVAAEIINGMV